MLLVFPLLHVLDPNEAYWLEGVQERERDGGEGAGAKEALTLTRRAATPRGPFKRKELIVLDQASTDNPNTYKLYYKYYMY